MKIDAHQHFWLFDPIRDRWIDNSMQRLKRDFMPEDLKPVLVANGIDGCIAVQASQTLTETQFLLNIASNHDFVKAVVGWVDLQADNLAMRLANFKDAQKLVGFRHIVQSEPDEEFVLRPKFKRGIKSLSDYGFTYDILVFPNQLPAICKLVSEFPNQLFVLDHMAKPYIKAGEIDAWKQDIERLADMPNAYCKVSGIITEADWHNWTYDEIIPYLDVIFEAFGTNRIMFGSDWPVCLLAGSYSQVKQLIDKYLLSFTKEEVEKVMGRNAQSFYKI